MFSPGSRYQPAGPAYPVSLPDGAPVLATPLPLPQRAPVLGYHPRTSKDRLDLLAVQYLNAPTGFWRICDANNAMVAGRSRRARRSSASRLGARHERHVPAAASAGQPVPDALCRRRSAVEVEENSDRPGALAAASCRSTGPPPGTCSSSATAPSSRRRTSRSRSSRRGRRPGPVHLRRLRPVLAAAPGPRVDLVDHRRSGPRTRRG